MKLKSIFLQLWKSYLNQCNETHSVKCNYSHFSMCQRNQQYGWGAEGYSELVIFIRSQILLVCSKW